MDAEDSWHAGGHWRVTRPAYLAPSPGTLYIPHGKIHEINTWECHAQGNCSWAIYNTLMLIIVQVGLTSGNGQELVMSLAPSAKPPAIAGKLDYINHVTSECSAGAGPLATAPYRV